MLLSDSIARYNKTNVTQCRRYFYHFHYYMHTKKNLSTVLVVIILIGAFLVLRAAIVGQLSSSIKDSDFEEDALKAAAGCTPPTLSNIQVTGIGSNTATITWTTNQQSTSVVRLGLTAGSMSWLTTKDTPASTSGVTLHSYTLTGIQAARTYYYRVRSSNGTCQTTSTTKNFATLGTSSGTPDVTAPTTPAGVSAAGIGSTSFTLNWNPSLDPTVVGAITSDVKGYEVYGPTGACNVNSSAGYCGTVLHTGLGSYSMLISGLSPSTTYTGSTGATAGFTIKAFDNAGNYAVGTPRLSVTTTGTDVCPNIAGIQLTIPTGLVLDLNGNCVTPADTVAPTAPTNLTSPSKTQSTVALSWTASTDNSGSVAGYNVYINGSTSPANASLISGTTYTASGLSAATSYSFTVRAFDAAGNGSAASNSITVTTNTGTVTDTTAPSKPTGLSATSITSTSFVLNWTASTDDTLSASQIHYDVYGSSQACNVNSTPGYCGAVTGATSMTISGLSPSTTYNAASGVNAGFVVQAYDNAAHYSTGSSILSVTTIAGADVTPPTISNIAVTTTTSTAVVTWTTNENATTVVNYGPTTAYGFNVTIPASSTSHSANITSLTSGNTYHYQVKSADAAGNIATSADLTFTAQSSPTACGSVPLKDQRQVWVWHDTVAMLTAGSYQTNLFNYVDAKHIDMIYMDFTASQITANATAIKNFLNLAWNSHCAQVQILEGQPDWVNPPFSSAIAWATAVKNLDASITGSNVHPYGLNVDVENYSSLSSATGRSNYIGMYTAMKNAVAGTNLKIVGVAPRWYDTSTGIDASSSVRMAFMQSFIDTVDEVGLMDYVVTASSFYADAANELAYASQVGKKVILGAETIDLTPWGGSNGPTSFYGKTCADLNNMFDGAYTTIMANSPNGFGGFAVHDLYQTGGYLGGWQALCP